MTVLAKSTAAERAGNRVADDCASGDRITDGSVAEDDLAADPMADAWLAIPWAVADGDDRRRLLREMALRALI
ncbi:MAG: hypothetical protein LBV34_17000 [Nocardiopsaceae bacterium]|jgi:hypothetical protein|nr:hypothetical protein [Nocardiopsaceae bacterium]